MHFYGYQCFRQFIKQPYAKFTQSIRLYSSPYFAFSIGLILFYVIGFDFYIHRNISEDSHSCAPYTWNFGGYQPGQVLPLQTL